MTYSKLDHDLTARIPLVYHNIVDKMKCLVRIGKIMGTVAYLEDKTLHGHSKIILAMRILRSCKSWN